MIFDRHANLKYKYGNRQFWCRGYFVDTVGRNKKTIAEYIRNQLQEDIGRDNVNMKEHIDQFTGEQVGKGKIKAAPLRGSRKKHAVGRTSLRLKALLVLCPYRACACHRLPPVVMTVYFSFLASC